MLTPWKSFVFRGEREIFRAGGLPKYGRVMPNISAYNCADYEVNLSATERMSRQSVSESVAHSFIQSVTVSRAGIMAPLAAAEGEVVGFLVAILD